MDEEQLLEIERRIAVLEEQTKYLQATAHTLAVNLKAQILQLNWLRTDIENKTVSADDDDEART